PMFSPVIVKCLTVISVPQWEIDGATRRALDDGSSFTVYLLAGTRINLYQNATLFTSLIVGNGKMVIITYESTATWTWDWSS
ncbi:MAG: hypothetical protein JW795_11645, partial [Chitinivibrionales bacterium]|nr:hypothetical protein [Chitinivibrionales bacterium]